MYRWTNIVKLFYTTYISVDDAHTEIFRAKVGKGGIKSLILHRAKLTGVTKCMIRLSGNASEEILKWLIFFLTKMPICCI